MEALIRQAALDKAAADAAVALYEAACDSADDECGDCTWDDVKRAFEKAKAATFRAAQSARTLHAATYSRSNGQ
jgi:hypothetical protein